MPDRYGDNNRDPDNGPTHPPSDLTLGQPESAINEAREHYRLQAITDCRLCDGDGYRGSTVCDHTDHTAAAARGMDRIRETMGWKP